MAAYRKRKNGWLVEVRRKHPRTGESVYASATFSTKAEATTWANETESRILSGKHQLVQDIPVHDVLQEYHDKISPKKQGKEWEQKRLKLLMRSKLAKIRLPKLSKFDIVEWRDERLQTIQPESVRREWTILNDAFNHAIKEWGWMEQNPMADVKRPSKGLPRDRRITDEEIEKITVATGFDWETTPDTVMARVGAIFLFCLETAIRQGEATKIEWPMVNEKTVELPAEVTKTNRKRTVPLSTRAKKVLTLLKPLEFAQERVFGLTTSQIAPHFTKARNRSQINDLRFHDSRAEALSRLAKKFDALDLAKISGHQDLRILLNHYYRPTSEELADRMD